MRGFVSGPIGLIREVEPPQSIVTCRQSDPRGHIAWRLFDRVLEILLCEAEIALVEPLDAEPGRLIRGIILDIAGILAGGWIGDRRRRQPRLVTPGGQQHQRYHQNQPTRGLGANADKSCTLQPFKLIRLGLVVDLFKTPVRAPALMAPVGSRAHKSQQIEYNREKNNHQDYRENT